MSQPIPQPPGLPILGNIKDIDPSNTWWSLKKLSEKYGEIFQVKILGKTLVFVAGAALAEELCDEKRFRKFVGGPIVEIRALVHDSLFTAFDHEASWGVHHRIIAPKLSPQALNDSFVEMRDITGEMIQKWQGFGADKKFSPLDELNRLNMETTAYTLFGKRMDNITGPAHPVIQAMEDSTSEAIRRPTRPGLFNWLFYGGKFKNANKVQRAWAADLVQFRKDNPTERRDLLDALLTAKDPETGKSLSESQVVDEIATMPIGSSTAPCLLTAAVLFLIQNPQVVAQARQELDSVVGEGELQQAHLGQLKYVEGVMREALRLAYPAPGFNIEPIPREGDKSPVLLGGGKYQMAHNQAVIVVLAGVNRDASVFEEPLAFRPERMMGESFERLPAGVKKWFGNGKRECVGKHWAVMFMMVVLARMIKEVDFEAADPNYKLEQNGWFNVRPVDFYAKVKPRAI
ncbi:cytochrome P450 [Astrocystis sublimbata]|nr:cytochrome P450 [Astrocystis sublimbata]